MKRFATVAVWAFVGLVGAAAATNVVVDPYRIFRLVDVDGFNAKKPRASQQLVLLKSRGIRAVKPANLVVGNSRAAIAFDPESKHWPSAGPTYNAAIPGTGTATSVEMLRAAISAGEVRHVLVGIEFFDFLVDPGSSPVPASGGEPPGWGRILASTVFSLDALLDSVTTVALQRRAGVPDVTALGFNPMQDYETIVEREGYGPMFAQRTQENARAYPRKPRALFVEGTRSSAEWSELDELLRLCREHDIRLDLVIYPYHAHLLELIRITGLWPQFEEWKRELVRRIETDGSDVATTQVRLWDFSGYHRYASERAPRLGDRTTRVAWYWELGHFKKALGDEMLRVVFGIGAKSDFGVTLSTKTVEPRLDWIRRDQAAYEASHVEDIAYLEALARSVTPARRVKLPPTDASLDARHAPTFALLVDPGVGVVSGHSRRAVARDYH